MNWDERIERAEKTGHFTEQDKADSNDTLSCSLAEQMRLFHGKYLHHKIVRIYYADSKINNLSYNFRDNVYLDNISGAKETHNKIKKIERIVK